MEIATSKKGKPVEIGDPFARSLIGKYLGKRRDDIGKLRRALSDRDYETIRITGHNLYGSGAAYGLDEISNLGASIERAANAQDAARIERLIDEMADFIGALRVF